MNEIPEVDDTCYAVFVDEGVQATDVVVDDLRALHLQLWKHLSVEVIENLLDDAAAPLFFYVVSSRAKRGRLGEIPE